MKYTISANTVFPLVEIELNKNERVQIENGAMVYHNGEINLEGSMNSNGRTGISGAVHAFGRSISSGENFFITTATGKTDQAMVAIAPSTPGAIKELQVGSEHWRLNTGVFLAGDPNVTYNMKRQKIGRAIFGGTGGLFIMETAGEGSLLVNSYGDIVEIELDGTKPFVVDNQHVVAWSSGLDYSIEIGSGTFGFKTGEGLVNEFHGTGTVLIQTRNAEALANYISPYLISTD